MGNTLTEIEAYAQDVAIFSQAIETGFQAVSSTFPALLANFQSLLVQVQTSVRHNGGGVGLTAACCSVLSKNRSNKTGNDQSANQNKAKGIGFRFLGHEPTYHHSFDDMR
jgi:hypothetical protein